MTVKTTGAEWNRFYADKTAWPEGTWHEAEQIKVDGEEAGGDLTSIHGSAVVTVSGGVVYFDEVHEGPSLEAHFKRWLKKQTTTVLIVEVPNEAAEAVQSAIANAGGRVRT